MKLAKLINEGTLNMSHTRDFGMLFSGRRKMTLVEASARPEDATRFEFFNHLTLLRFMETILTHREEVSVDPVIEIKGYSITVKNSASPYDGSSGSEDVYMFQHFIEQLSIAYQDLVENEGNDY